MRNTCFDQSLVMFPQIYRHFHTCLQYFKISQFVRVLLLW